MFVILVKDLITMCLCYSCFFAKRKNKVLVRVFVCVRMCMCVCACVCFPIPFVSVCMIYINSKRNRSRNMKFKYIEVNENNWDKFDIGHCRTKVNVTARLQNFSPFTSILSGPITQLWYI